MTKVKVGELKKALANMDDESFVEIAVDSFNKSHPVYIPLMTDNRWGIVCGLAPGGNIVRLYSTLPSNDKTYTIFVERKRT